MNQSPNRDSPLQDALAELQQPVAPSRDPWPDIRLAMAHTAQLQPARRRWPLALAAALALTVFSSVWWSQRHEHSPAAGVAQSAGNAQTTAATEPAHLDPRLIAAAIELDAARMELELALRRAPEAQFLKNLLSNTTERRQQLIHIHRPAG